MRRCLERYVRVRRGTARYTPFMAAKPTPSPHEVAQALRTIADELDKQTAPLSDEMANKLMPLVSASRAVPARFLELLETASRLVRSADIAELADSLEVDATEAALIRDEIAAARAVRRAGG